MTPADKLRFLADRIDDGKEFYVDDCLFVYRIGVLMIALDETEKDYKFIKSDMSLNSIIWLDLKLKPQWGFTEDEKVILRNLHDDFQWIARDKDRNELYVYTSEPTKATNQHWVYNGDVIDFNHFKHIFQSVQWEDDEPCEFRKYL